jgi:hypothetical protein
MRAHSGSRASVPSPVHAPSQNDRFPKTVKKPLRV